MCDYFESEQLGTNDSDFDHCALGKSNPIVCPLDHLQAMTGAIQSSDWDTQLRGGTARSKSSDLEIPPVTFH